MTVDNEYYFHCHVLFAERYFIFFGFIFAMNTHLCKYGSLVCYLSARDASLKRHKGQ
jgi:hypothetical protein